ncbi:MAG: hypothetical protein ABEJ22_02285 [Haloferacaceae archaeon]
MSDDAVGADHDVDRVRATTAETDSRTQCAGGSLTVVVVRR